MTATQLHLIAKELSEELNTKLTVYYIGNCGVDSRGQFDDRSWAIKFDDFTNWDRNHYALHNEVIGESQQMRDLDPDQLRLKLKWRFDRLTSEASSDELIWR